MSHTSRRGTTSTECPLASLGRNTPSLNTNLYHHPLSSSPLDPQVYEMTRKSPILQIKSNERLIFSNKIQQHHQQNLHHQNQHHQNQLLHQSQLHQSQLQHQNKIHHPNEIHQNLNHHLQQTKHNLLNSQQIQQQQRPQSSSSSNNNLGNSTIYHLSQSSSSSVEKPTTYGLRRHKPKPPQHQQMDSLLSYHERSSPSPKSYLLEDRLDVDHSSSNNDSQSEKYFAEDVKMMNTFYHDNTIMNNHHPSTEHYYLEDNLEMCHYTNNSKLIQNSLVQQRSSIPSETSESDRYLIEQINHLKLTKQRNLDKSPFVIPRYHTNSPQSFVNGLSRICRYSPTFDQGYHTLVSPSPTGQQTPGPWNKRSNNSTRNGDEFDRLPDDVVLKIFSWLDNCELCKIARVSRRFEVLIWKPILWKIIRLKVNMDGDRALKIIFKKLCRQSRAGNCIGVEHILLSDGCKVTDKGMQLISRKCPELTHLQIQFSASITNSSLLNLLTQCSNLQHLDITGCTQITYLDTVPSLENQMSRKLLLQYLDLTDCSSITDNGLKIIVKNCPQLVFVYLRRCVQITDAGLKHIPNFCIALRELSVSDCSNITDFGLYELAKLGATLRYLSVAKCDKISDAGLKVIVRRCYKLRYLNARGCEAVSDDSITVLAKSCPRLRALDIGKCDVSDIGLRALAESCPNLKKLGLRNCDMITDVGIQCIAYFCRGLQQLNIQDCQITIEGYRAVKKYCKRCVIEHTNPGFC